MEKNEIQNAGCCLWPFSTVMIFTAYTDHLCITFAVSTQSHFQAMLLYKSKGICI